MPQPQNRKRKRRVRQSPEQAELKVLRTLIRQQVRLCTAIVALADAVRLMIDPECVVETEDEAESDALATRH